MSDKETLYARWLTGDLNEEEIQALKSSGEWEELSAILASTNQIQMPEFDTDKAYEALRPKNSQTKSIAPKVVQLRRWIAFAASIILIAAFFFLARRTRTSSSSA